MEVLIRNMRKINDSNAVELESSGNAIATEIANHTRLMDIIIWGLQNNWENDQGHHPKMFEYGRFKPATISHMDEDPLVADNWLTTISKKLNIVSENDKEKVHLASYQPRRAADEWWEYYYEAIEGGEAVTWNKFQRGI